MRCPTCGFELTVHPGNACLSRWVSQVKGGKYEGYTAWCERPDRAHELLEDLWQEAPLSIITKEHIALTWTDPKDRNLVLSYPFMGDTFAVRVCRAYLFLKLTALALEEEITARAEE